MKNKILKKSQKKTNELWNVFHLNVKIIDKI
jgi:hypothetical protein